MGLFDKKGSSVAEPQQQLGALKQKYQSVLTFMEQQQVRVQNLHVENGKLVIRASAPSEDVKNRIWNQIKLVDSHYADLTADITVAPGQGGSAGATASPSARTYTVKSGDTLSKISKEFYGDANRYSRIFEATATSSAIPTRSSPARS